MSISKLIRNTLLLPIAVVIFLAGTAFVSVTLNTNAQSISLEPVSIDRSNPDERGWFLYNVQPGQTVEDTVVVRNATTFDTRVQLNANDATVTTDGTFSLKSNEQENTSLGSWITLSQTELSIGGNESIGVPFTITVPSDAQSGEYAGGLSAIIINEEENDGIGARLRLGVRMYLTVDGNLSLNPEISELSIANPDQEDFEERLRSRGSVKPESMGFYLTAKELGNIYTKSVNSATFELPDGTTETLNFTRNYIPGQPVNEFYIETKIPYQVGQTTVTLDYEAAPFIDNKPNLNRSNDTGSVTYVLDMSQEDYDTFLEVYNSIKDVKDARRGQAVESTPDPDRQRFTIQEGNITEVTPEEEEESDTNMYIVYGLIGVIAVLIIALIVVALKNNKKSETSQTTDTKANKSN